MPVLVSVGQVLQSLCNENAAGIVVMRFERCAYLQFNNQLVCIGLAEIGASSIAGLFDQAVYTLPAYLKVGAKAQLSTKAIVLDHQYHLDLQNALPFVCLLRSPDFTVRMPATQPALLSELNGPSSGFAPLLQHMTPEDSFTDGVVISQDIKSELLDFVLPAIAELTQQLRANISAELTDSARVEFSSVFFQNLIGAGPGLTPSGDDFLCGVFTTLHLSGFSDIANALWDSVRIFTEQSTTQVSTALLEQAALGESGERIDAVIKAYFDHPAVAAARFQQLVELIGETSGWDWLTGFVLCQHLIAAEQTRASSGAV